MATDCRRRERRKRVGHKMHQTRRRTLAFFFLHSGVVSAELDTICTRQGLMMLTFFLCALWGWDVIAELDTICTRQGLRTLAVFFVYCGDVSADTRCTRQSLRTLAVFFVHCGDVSADTRCTRQSLRTLAVFLYTMGMSVLS